MTGFIKKENNTTDQITYLVAFKLRIPVNDNAVRYEHILQISVVVLRISE